MGTATVVVFLVGMLFSAALGSLIVAAALVYLGLCHTKASEDIAEGFRHQLSDGAAADIKRQVKALDGALEDAVNRFDHRYHRDDTRSRRAAPAPTEPVTKFDRLRALREISRGGTGNTA